MWSITRRIEREKLLRHSNNATTISTCPSFCSFFFSAALCHFTKETTMQCVPSSVPHILLLYPYLSYFFYLSIGSFLLFHQGRGYISSYPAPSPSPTFGKSLFLYLSVFLSSLQRDNYVQALSSFSSLKRSLPSRHREAESAF